MKRVHLLVKISTNPKERNFLFQSHFTSTALYYIISVNVFHNKYTVVYVDELAYTLTVLQSHINPVCLVTQNAVTEKPYQL
jgi:hypothetical protein